MLTWHAVSHFHSRRSVYRCIRNTASVTTTCKTCESSHHTKHRLTVNRCSCLKPELSSLLQRMNREFSCKAVIKWEEEIFELSPLRSSRLGIRDFQSSQGTMEGECSPICNWLLCMSWGCIEEITFLYCSKYFNLSCTGKAKYFVAKAKDEVK